MTGATGITGITGVTGVTGVTGGQFRYFGRMRDCRIFVIAAILACILQSCEALSPAPAAPPAPIVLERPPLTLTIDPALGGRITSLTFGGQEVLKTERDSADLQWGSTAWTSPQRDWDWPPIATFDREAYTLGEVEEHSVTMMSEVDPATGLQLTKYIRMGPEDDVGLTYFLTNKGDSTASVAAWEITRLPYAGRIEFAADSVRSETVTLKPERDSTGFTISFDDRWEERAKVFADINGDFVTYTNGGLQLRKYTSVKDRYRTAPGQAPLEVYWNPAAGFVEFELQGDYRKIGFGETATLRTRWQIVRE